VLSTQAKNICITANDLLDWKERLQKMNAFSFSNLIVLNSQTISDVDFLIAAICLQLNPKFLRRVVMTGTFNFGPSLAKR
jgi:hypothetical protein